jgi:DNA modification methylase
MVIGFKPRFVQPILNGTKIHTLREDVLNRWQPGRVMHMAIGVRTTNYYQFNEVQQGNKKLNEKRIHPCHKPVMLYDAIFKEFGIYKMKVIDTHLGSGSSRITADKFECEFVGAEIDSEYFQDEEKRWFNYKRNLKLALW